MDRAADHAASTTAHHGRAAVLLVLSGLVLALSPTVHAQTTLPTPGAISVSMRTVPTPETIIERVLNVEKSMPSIASIDFVGRLRVRKPPSAPPDCVFAGAMNAQQGRHFVTITHGTAGLLCWMFNRFFVSRLFEGGESLETFLSRFEFQVLGEKVVDLAPYYLVQGKVRQSTNGVQALIGWVDYERGVVTEGTIQYPWGNIDTEQQYAWVNEAWILARQYAYIPRFETSLELAYSNYHFERILPSR